jgi:hypothetical protein
MKKINKNENNKLIKNKIMHHCPLGGKIIHPWKRLLKKMDSNDLLLDGFLLLLKCVWLISFPCGCK